MLWDACDFVTSQGCRNVARPVYHDAFGTCVTVVCLFLFLFFFLKKRKKIIDYLIFTTKTIQLAKNNLSVENGIT